MDKKLIDASLPLEPPATSFWQGWVRAWNRFWFTPADPIVLGLVRLCCGMLAFYTLVTYSWDLQAFFGRDAWYNLDYARQIHRDSPVRIDPLNWTSPQKLPDMKNLTAEQQKFVTDYIARWRQNPPPPYPKTQAEADAINRYIERWGVDPRDVYSRGRVGWSIWFHVTDPTAMAVVHGVFTLTMLLFAIGFCTRITSVLAWFIFLCYVHRSPVTLFGYDTMTLILLSYLMIGPSGAALSVDRFIARWWRRRPGLDDGTGPDRPRPSVSANVAMRMLQIHVCFVYAAAGLSKLQGTSWWTGVAIWGTLANAEFAPIQSEAYMFVMRWLIQHIWMLQILLAAGTYFTLFFEIAYPFMIWGKNTRWLILGMAVMLHGVIGTLMGLKTFALIMLVMNAAFLPPQTVHWMLGKLRQWTGGIFQSPATEAPIPAVVGVGAAAPVSTKIKQKQT